MKNHKQAVFGAILGQAIGDAMGHPTEFCKSVAVSELSKNNQFTDDTQMALAIGEAILAFPPNKDLELFMREVGKNFVRWDDASHTSKDPELVELAQKWGENTRAPGSTCMAGVRMLRQGIHWTRAGSGEGGKGNGGVMRASIVGAALWKDPVFAWKIGGLTSIPTHNNLESILASAGIAYLVASSINGFPMGHSVAMLLELSAEWWSNLIMWPENVRDQIPEFAIGRIGAAYALGKAGTLDAAAWRSFNGNDFKGVEALAAAIYYNVKHSNFRDVITGLANNTGDSDTTAAIGGALAGARWGYGMIPSMWRQTVESSLYLHDLAKRIWDYSNTVGTHVVAETLVVK